MKTKISIQGDQLLSCLSCTFILFTPVITMVYAMTKDQLKIGKRRALIALIIISTIISAIILFSTFEQYQNGDILGARMLITTWLSVFISLAYIIVIFFKRITRLIESEAILPDTYTELKAAINRDKVSLNWHMLFAMLLCIFIMVAFKKLFI